MALFFITFAAIIWDQTDKSDFLYAYIPILIYEISLNKINVMVGIIIGKYGFEYTKIKIKLNFSNNFCSYFYYPKQTAVGIISFSYLSHQ